MTAISRDYSNSSTAVDIGPGVDEFIKDREREKQKQEDEEKPAGAEGNIYLRLGWKVILLMVAAIVIVYIVLRPSKPKFSVQDATVVRFNLTQPNLLTTQMQVTVAARNPNDHIGIYYDTLEAYAFYESQQITTAAPMSPLYQGTNDGNLLSPSLYGNEIAIASFLAEDLLRDQVDGFFFLTIRIVGRIRWSVGSWTSGHYRLIASCPAYLSFDRSASSAAAAGGGNGGMEPVIRFRQSSDCSVHI